MIREFGRWQSTNQLMLRNCMELISFARSWHTTWRSGIESGKHLFQLKKNKRGRQQYERSLAKIASAQRKS